MKTILSAVLLNLALFVVSILIYISIIFFLGYANGEHNIAMWVIFALFVLIHLGIFWLIARRRKILARKFIISGVVTMGVLYGTLVIDSFF